eukprot:CAMPEP_0171162646 /NCGR_PEP_ID=MMETSP0790-20130122/4699_1 /TAXON_ID=2925 /ORGANISM="Alexandrium catenella, Strain OF101" /LENGTH=135 /DNA_ID=CAMNT_0011627255 /DNA_START=50 /DNA_END=457 /DNA_ORIENTATION=+
MAYESDSDSDSSSSSSSEREDEDGYSCWDVLVEDAADIRFSQASISSRFRDGTKLSTTIRRLRQGRVHPDDIETMLVYQTRSGKNWVTHDNRRLYCYQEAECRDFWVVMTNRPVPDWKYSQGSAGYHGRDIDVRH